MALFSYQVVDSKGQTVNGQIEALSETLAMQSLQARGYVVVALRKTSARGSGLKMKIRLTNRPPTRALVIMTRQLATLFESQISALKVIGLMSETTDNDILREAMAGISEEVKSGTSLTQAMQKYPNVFSDFYIGMVRAGSESGTLAETFVYLADYMERQYELVRKTRNALIYPAFVIFTFATVMILMLVMIIPRLGEIIVESGQPVPPYTQFVLALSSFFVNWGWLLLIFLVIAGISLVFYLRRPAGRAWFDEFKLKIPILKNLFNKLYLARIADNMNTMLSTGIPVLRSLEITAGVVGSRPFQKVIEQSMADVKGGQLISVSMSKHKLIPKVMVQMMRVGEETGSLGSILKTMARFYKREVDTAVDAMIGLIEPVLIVLLALGVGFLLTAVLMPIYNLSNAF